MSELHTCLVIYKAYVCTSCAQNTLTKKKTTPSSLFPYPYFYLCESGTTYIRYSEIISLQSLLEESGGLKIVAIGSVMTKAWDLLKEGKLAQTVCAFTSTCVPSQAHVRLHQHEAVHVCLHPPSQYSQSHNS